MKAVSALEYHRQTSYQRHKMTAHFMDWANQPNPYKGYPGVEPILLPQDNSFPNDLLSHVLKKESEGQFPAWIRQEQLARIFQLTYSLTAKTRQPEGSFYYRSVASAGALYPTEIYLAVQGIKSLDNGLYHFSIAQQGLNSLRKGDFLTVRAKVDPNEGEPPGLLFFLSAIFFRSAWKYRDRAFRYHLLDTGHLIENLLLALKALGLPGSLSYDFDDRQVTRFLGLDAQKEIPLALVAVAEAGLQTRDHLKGLPELAPAMISACQVSQAERPYPLIEAAYQAGSTLRRPAEGTPGNPLSIGWTPKQEAPLPKAPAWPEIMAYPDAVIQRRSRRNYLKDPVSREALTALLEGLALDETDRTRGFPAVPELLSLGLLIGRAEGFEPGFYLLDPSRSHLSLVHPGLFMTAMARICLDQDWLANGAVHFLFITNLKTLEERFGARGYRYAMQTAGRLGERLYLLSTALGLGCCGIGAYYDQEAADLLGLEEASRLLYLVAVGPVKKSSMTK